ncbi:branched-chain amino acid ABC transporter permease [Aquabacter spiritensis]|uniref:Amino acid/amide ABC transporter membrane protein 1 (HAAT family) n=1 Tax=Aquabacter spiritensis TaxID=933073 RepID=A0A4R3LUS1_9HYPH|nr:branched-chain amino acid ABC transporter permease [Aquabacter spiritensis]TCT04350.1 amino acid/amide ABC transporter membrane protein 1 (HAAT family) [Aquabacter spiritensis]
MTDLLPSLETVLQTLATGLLVGCTYGLMCVALGLIFGIMRLINFAQGDFLMLGMYFGLAVLSGAGLGATIGPLPALIFAGLAAIPVFFVLGWVIHALLLARIAQRRGATEGEAHQTQLIMTLGISLVLSNGALMAFGSTPVSLNVPFASQAFILDPLGAGDVLVFLNEARVLAAVAALAAAGGLYALLHRTDLGRQLRASADNPLAATYMGIDVVWSYRVTFGLGFGLTALAGVMVATYYPFQPYVGLDFVIVMYAGVVLGGLGSVMGSFWGGVIIGLVQQLSTLVLPLQLQGTTVFVVFLLILLIRPQGLFGRSVERA